jgi:hypothetical protein
MAAAHAKYVRPLPVRREVVANACAVVAGVQRSAGGVLGRHVACPGVHHDTAGALAAQAYQSPRAALLYPDCFLISNCLMLILHICMRTLSMPRLP